uniref:F-box domain-containing protein n=1 Tax=Moniliophthora roreri TaxID=221103 RepID=A0A0W0EUA3_MONRR
MSSFQPPSLLFNAPSYWRQVAISLPALWTSLHLDIGHTKAGNTQESVPINSPAMLTCFLERSAKRTLRVSIAVAKRGTISTFQPLLDILMQTCSCWISLKMTGDLERLSESHFLNHYGTPQLPKLEKVELEGPFDILRPCSDLPAGLKLQDAIERNAPHLSSISLRNLRTFTRKQFSWDRITHLEVDDYTQLDILMVLRQCTRLDTLVLHHDGFISLTSQLQDAKPVEVGSLRKLRIPSTSVLTLGHQYERLSSYLILPRLVHLELSNVRHGQTLDPILMLLARSKCNIETIEVHMRYLMDVTIEDFLQFTPHTKRLILRGHWVLGHIFDCIASDDDMLVPELEHLSVLFTDISELSSPTNGVPTISPPLAQILRAAKALPNLKTLHVECFDEAFDADLIPELENISPGTVSTCIVARKTSCYTNGLPYKQYYLKHMAEILSHVLVKGNTQRYRDGSYQSIWENLSLFGLVLRDLESFNDWDNGELEASYIFLSWDFS